MLQSWAADAEQLGQLHPQQLAVIYREKWFSLFVPQQYGGLQCSLPNGLHIEEELAYTDGSIGWTVTLCSGAGWFAAFLPVDAARQIFANPYACLAGSGMSTGTAIASAEGYIVNGHWQNATGAPHATMFTANALVESKGQTALRTFWFLPHEITIDNSWDCMGMVATASHGFAVNDLQIPKERCFDIVPNVLVVDEPLYRYPFMAFAEATLAVNYLGMCRRFIDECCTLIALKYADDPLQLQWINPVLQQQWQQFTTVRNAFYAIVEASWQEMLEQNNVSDHTLQQINMQSRKVAATVRQITGLLYPYAGLRAAKKSTVINRVWRDLYTALQHPLLMDHGM